MAGEDDDSSRPKSVVGSSSDFNLSFGDPLYLYPNYTSGTPIVTIKSCKKDSSNHGLANQWDMCNYVVVTCIINSLSSELFVGAIYAKTASEMWNDLKETYDKVDGSAMFNLHKNIYYLNQTGSTLADYYNNLNSLWKQFDAMIVDSEANQHMTVSVKFLSNAVDISNLGLTVGHHNGTQALITKIRDLKINNKVTLYDVLVVPEYTVSLLSVHKLSKDSKLFVGFDENNCYIRDLKANRAVGIGKQYNGLYLFDVDNALSSDITQSNDDSGATSMDETNNTHHEGTVPNETDFINDFYKNLESNSETKELPVYTFRRSFRQTKLPSSLNEFIVEGKVKYSVERVVNYANLNHDNYCFVAALNKSIEPTC
nr:ribonuclease H-like domain-containing protein [Tanacetum cinerariifolium]